MKRSIKTRRIAARKPARRPRHKKFHSRVWELIRRQAGVLLILVLLGVFVHDVFGRHGFLEMRRSQKEVEQIQREIDELNRQNQELADRVKALKSDPQLIERIAREQMNLARPGEYIYRLPPKPESEKIDRKKY